MEETMRYQYHDGFEFEADTPEQVCRALMNSMLFPFNDTLEEWMRDHAERCEAWNSKPYRDDSFEHHVADLLRHGILTEISG